VSAAAGGRDALQLAFAFLDGDWTEAGLLRRGALVLGNRRPQLRTLVRRLLRAYPRPPWDRPRELARWLDTTPAFARGSAARAQSVRWLIPQPAMGEMPWPVPAIPTGGELAHFLGLTTTELEWLADVRSLERTAADERLRHYRYRWIPKASGGLRLLEAPKARLRTVQRLLLHAVLDRIPAHAAAHGFVPGRSVLTFVRPHAGAAVLIRLDLENFFGSVAAGRVFGVFRTAGYPEAVAHTLTGLTTNVVPLQTWREAPGRPFALGRLLATPHLPQGAPTAPALANLCAHELDRRLAGLAETFGLAYTRYADDLALSGALSRRATARVIELAVGIAAEAGFAVNHEKTLVMSQGGRMRLAGVVVNQHPNLERREHDRLRAVLHNAGRQGLASQNRAGHDRFAEHLAGRVAWARALNPTRAAALERLLAEMGQGA
jgi:RNA-directed DNA polymerase